MPPPQPEPSNRTYFLIIGVGRSGTTLLGNCLDAHPEVACLNEAADDALRGKDLPAYTALRRLAGRRITSRLAAALEHNVDQFYGPDRRAPGGQEPVGVLRARAFCAQTGRLLAARPERVAGNKITTESLAMIYRKAFTPNETPAADALASQRAERLKYFCELFGEYRLLFIVRDGRLVVRSKMKRAGIAAGEAAARWIEGARIHRALRAAAGARMLTVRFEALLAQPEQTLRAASAHLGVAYQAEMLAGARRGYAAEKHTGFDQASLNAPRPAAHDAWLRESLLYFNYPVE